MLARVSYNSLTHLLIPFVVIVHLWRGRKNWRRCLDWQYNKRFFERFGFFIPSLEKGLWVHAVSVGETMAAGPFINEWRKKYPLEPVFITTMTATGSAQVRLLWGNTVQHSYAPYDLPWAWRLFLKKVKPRALVIMETELWPNMIRAIHKRNIPIILANARLSERSARGYARTSFWSIPMLNAITRIAAQDAATAERFIALGVAVERVEVTGTLKYDISCPLDIKNKALALQSKWQLSRRKIIVAASTHGGEEELILSSFLIIKEKIPGLLLILVPRHPERFNQVAHLISQYALSMKRRSKDEPVTEETQVFLGDSMGELMLWYSMADIAIVGGSFVTIGGHNVLEPMACDVPTLTGPYVVNFQTIVDELVSKKALLQIMANQMTNTIIPLLENPAIASAQVLSAKTVLSQNKGALAKLMIIAELCFFSASK